MPWKSDPDTSRLNDIIFFISPERPRTRNIVSYESNKMARVAIMVNTASQFGVVLGGDVLC